MADKSFGVKELNLLNASGTPTVTSPNNLNLNANTVAISTSCTIGNNLTITSTTTSANANVTGIATVVNFNATGISTIAQPADSNPMANWTITNNSASAYRFTGPGQSGTEDNPNIYLVRGHRYIFKHNATSSHPIQIRFANAGSAYTDGITYSEATNGGQTTDGNNLIFNVQHDAPAQLFYQCTAHGGMVGNIYIVGGPQVISGVVTATTFSGSGASLTNLPAGNLTGVLPAISGANLTSLPSQLSTSNMSNNRVVTSSGGVVFNGEANLTFDGTTLYTVGDYMVKDPTTASYVTHTFAGNYAKIDVRGTNIANSNHYLIGYGAGHSSANQLHLVNTVGDLVLRNGSGNALEVDSNRNIKATAGNFVVGTAGKGIDFSITSDASGSSSELFDDYEEGSWTPTGSWTTIVARYTKIGRMVYAGFSLRANTSSGNVTIGGFPFTSANNHAASGGIAWGLCEHNSSSGWLNGSISDNSTSATIRRNNAVVLTFGSGQDNMNNGAFLRGTFIYHTA